MAKNEVKYGALLSYILVIFNTLYGLLINPYILKSVGMIDFGIYKTISSFTAAFMVLDLGMGGTMMRYIAKFRANKENDKISNYCAMSFIQAFIIIFLIALSMFFVYFSLDNIYGNTLNTSGLKLAQNLYIILAVNLCLHVVENVINGIITGYNKFVFSNGIKIFRLALRILCLLVLLALIKNTLIVVLVDLLVTILAILIEVIYIKKHIKLKIKYSYWDKFLFFDSFKYTLLMFITSIAAQVNGNFANAAIGAIKGPAAVTVYSYGVLIFSMFEQLSTSISSVMLPSVTNILVNDDDCLTQAKDMVIKVGRVQFILLGAAMCGFAVVGKEFLHFWLGNGFDDVYYIVLILMAPSILELCVNVCLSILRAKNMLGFRTFILLATTALNVVITIVGTYFFNYYAAAIGTALSFLIGSVIIMNIYYYKKFRFNMFKIYVSIFHRIVPCIILSGICSYFAKFLFNSTFLKLISGIVVFMLIYGITLLTYGLSKYEKSKIFNYKRRTKNG